MFKWRKITYKGGKRGPLREEERKRTLTGGK